MVFNARMSSRRDSGGDGDDARGGNPPTLRSTGAQSDGSVGSHEAEPRLILLFSDRRPLLDDTGLCISLAAADEVVIETGARRSVTQDGRKIVIQLADRHVSYPHARIRCKVGSWKLEDLKSTNGTWVNGVIRSETTLLEGDVIAVGKSVLLFRTVGVGAKSPPGMPRIFPTHVGDLEQKLHALARASVSSMPILVRGPTGTGKERVARGIHKLSGRKGPLSTVNCGALAPELMESELFGHVRGAFSGATGGHEGIVRSADGGTLFLDEIGELSPRAQVALLRVLQEHEVVPVGSARAILVDIRVVAATHRELRAMVDEGKLRRDLYARLIGHQTVLPPLRKRREDIGLVIATILQDLGGVALNATFHRTAIDALVAYDYPLTIRELRLVLEDAMSQAGEAEIKLEHSPKAIRSAARRKMNRTPADDDLRAQLISLLEKTRGNLSAVGREMHLAPIQIRRLCARLGIDIDSFRDPTSDT